MERFLTFHTASRWGKVISIALNKPPPSKHPKC